MDSDKYKFLITKINLPSCRGGVTMDLSCASPGSLVQSHSMSLDGRLRSPFILLFCINKMGSLHDHIILTREDIPLL